MITDGTYRLLRDAPTTTLDATSRPVSPTDAAPSAVGETFEVCGEAFGLGPHETMRDAADRRFTAVRGVVVDTGPCTLLHDVSCMLADVPDLYRRFLGDESSAPLETATTALPVREVEVTAAETSERPAGHGPGRARHAVAVAALLLALLTSLAWWAIGRGEGRGEPTPVPECTVTATVEGHAADAMVPGTDPATATPGCATTTELSPTPDS